MPKVVDHSQRRAEIAMALWQVIYERGIDGVSFRSVAEAAGVSIGRVQHYFAGKDELVLYGCRQMVTAAVQHHGPQQGNMDVEAARARLTDLLAATIPDTEAFRIGASVWATYQAKAVSDPAIAAVVTEALTGRCDALAQLLVAARAATRGRAPCPTTADRTDALALASLSEGCAQRVLVGALEAEAARGLICAEVDRYLAS